MFFWVLYQCPVAWKLQPGSSQNSCNFLLSSFQVCWEKIILICLLSNVWKATSFTHLLCVFSYQKQINKTFVFFCLNIKVSPILIILNDVLKNVHLRKKHNFIHFILKVEYLTYINILISLKESLYRTLWIDVVLWIVSLEWKLID